MSSQAKPASIIREGSSLYYSLLWTEAEPKQRFCERLSLIRSLTTTLDDVQEPQVAEKKIHWWHEELQRLHQGEARHPSTTANQPQLTGLDAALNASLDIVSVASTQRFTPTATEEESDAHLVRSYGAKLALLCHALSDDVQTLATDQQSEKAALAFGLHDQLVRLPSLIHRGMPVFSDELYKQFSTQPQELAKHIRVADSPALNNIPIVTESTGRRELISHAIERAQKAFEEAVNDTPTQQRYRHDTLIPIWRLLVLRKKQLDLWQARKPDLLRETMTLTPIAKLYNAWKNKRPYAANIKLH